MVHPPDVQIVLLVISACTSFGLSMTAGNSMDPFRMAVDVGSSLISQSDRRPAIKRRAISALQLGWHASRCPPRQGRSGKPN